MDFTELHENVVDIDRSSQGIDRFTFRTNVRHMGNGEIAEERHGGIPDSLFTTNAEKRAAKAIHDQTLARIDNAIVKNKLRLAGEETRGRYK